jgi:hypothetical protein
LAVIDAVSASRGEPGENPSGCLDAKHHLTAEGYTGSGGQSFCDADFAA